MLASIIWPRRKVAVSGELAIDRFKNALADTGLDQALLERPDRGPIRNLAAGTQADEALEAQPIKQLEFHLLIGEVEQLLDQQLADHQFGGKLRAAAAFTAGTCCRTIVLGSECREVDMLYQHPQRIAKLVQLGFALLVGKHAGVDHENYVKGEASAS